MNTNDRLLEQRIEHARLMLSVATSRRGRLVWLWQLEALVKQRRPERVREMELERGLL